MHPEESARTGCGHALRCGTCPPEMGVVWGVSLKLRARSVPWISKTHARQNETLRICKIYTGRVFGPSVGQFRGNSLGGLGLYHAFVTLAMQNLENTQL